MTAKPGQILFDLRAFQAALMQAGRAMTEAGHQLAEWVNAWGRRPLPPEPILGLEMHVPPVIAIVHHDGIGVSW